MSAQAKYVGALIALLLLTAASVGISYLDFGRFALACALGLGLIKAWLVALYFMHLADEHVAPRFVFAVTAAFIVLLSLGVVADVALR